MGLLDKIWDDIVAGPTPEKGLGRLRKPSLRLQDLEETDHGSMNLRSPSDFQHSQTESPRVSKSILILKSRFDAFEKDSSLPSTPTGSTPPPSPFLESPSSEKGFKPRNIFRSTSKTDRGHAKMEDLSSPNVYDWVVLSALDK